MSIIDDINSAPMGDTGGQYLPPKFLGKVRVESVQEYKTRTKGDAFIAELEVVESNLPEVAVGGVYSWFQKMNESAPREIKNFLAACKGFDPYAPGAADAFSRAFPKKELAELYAAAVGEGNALGDTVLSVETYGKKTKAKTDFTVHRFTPAEQPAAGTKPTAPPPAADPYAGMQRDESGTLAWNGTAWIVMATGEKA